MEKYPKIEVCNTKNAQKLKVSKKATLLEKYPNNFGMISLFPKLQAFFFTSFRRCYQQRQDLSPGFLAGQVRYKFLPELLQAEAPDFGTSFFLTSPFSGHVNLGFVQGDLMFVGIS